MPQRRPASQQLLCVLFFLLEIERFQAVIRQKEDELFEWHGGRGKVGGGCCFALASTLAVEHQFILHAA